ncbi:hypothetical protein GCM10010191_19910 [Actinomadura vinacea]|uniref:Uncharacterized protein n=1 Tax=Actinomadura vinacea TaxID=115336 RepID=A0ABP5VWH1_9ACTN
MTGARAAVVAETVRTDGAEPAAKLLLDKIGRRSCGRAPAGPRPGRGRRPQLTPDQA